MSTVVKKNATFSPPTQLQGMRVRFEHDRKGKLNTKGKAAIYVRVAHNNQRRYLSTGIMVRPTEWDSKRERVKSSHRKSVNINAIISSLEQSALDYYYENRADFDINDLVRHLKGEKAQGESVVGFFKEYYRQRERKVKDSTIKQEKIMIDFLRRFKPGLTFSEIDHRFKARFEEWLLRQKNKVRGGHLAVNYVAKILDITRKYMKEARVHGLIQVDPFLNQKINRKHTKKIFLTGEELAKVEAVDVSHRRGLFFEVHQMFLFSCYTGLRFSDLIRVSKQHIYHDGEGLRLKMDMQKTRDSGGEINLPLYMLFEGRPANLIEKRITDANLFDELFGPVKPSYVKDYNNNLREIARIAGIEKNLSSHSGRHTCAMILLNEYGLSFEVVQAVLGHKSIATTQKHYAKMLTKGLDDRLRKALDKN